MARTLPLHSGYTRHNRAELIRGGRLYFDLLERLIQSAQELIFFQTYIFDGDITGTRIAGALSDAALRGVNVYVLLDAYASQGLSYEIIEEWRVSGVVLRWFQPLLKSQNFYVGRRLHHKILVVDAIDGLVGGINVSDKYNDLPGQEPWLDWAVHLQGESVKELHAVCARRAVRGSISRKEGFIPLPEIDEPLIATTCYVRIRVNDWVRRKMEISRSYIEMLRTAKSDVIMMSSYFMPGQGIRRSIRQAAKRGVAIKLVLAGVSDVKLAKLAERYLYNWLLRNGVEIYEYHKNILHGKISVCDGKWVTVGSYNLNELSARASVELNVDLIDRSFGRKTQVQLLDILTHQCTRVTEKTGAYRGPFNWLVYLMAYQLCRLLLFLFTFYFKQRKS